MAIVLILMVKQNWSLFDNIDWALLQLRALNGMLVCLVIQEKSEEKEAVIT